jgi:ribosome-binding factor A
MISFKRADRVADLLKVEISDILLKQIRDPRIGTVTITAVEITDDLRYAKVFFVEMGKDQIDDHTREGLQKAKGFLKRELGKRLKLRYIPDISFIFDKSFAYGNRIEKLIAEIHRQEEDDATKDS